MIHGTALLEGMPRAQSLFNESYTDQVRYGLIMMQ
jgi:hypothetical protein